MKRFKRHRDYGFFDQDIRLSKLTQLGDPLERLANGVDFEIFRDILTDGLHKDPKGLGGRPPFDYVLMFKILILQRYYNLSDDQTEFQVNDRMSFMRFLDLTMADDVPDSRTVWHFRERLTDLGLIEKLFDRFLIELGTLGLIVNEGRIIDASFVEVPRQRNSREDNKKIKEGVIPESISENPHRKAQKDTEARWTTKNDTHFFGYKNNIKGDTGSKIILKYVTTDASVHDSQALEGLLDAETDAGQDLNGDSAYTGQKQEDAIARAQMNGQICEKGYRGHPLTDEQKASNKKKSSKRARIEHIFGFMEMSMNGMYVHVIGKARVHAINGLMNLTYNMFRSIQLQAV